MVITLYAATLLARLKSISHREVAEIQDAEARYRAEAGTEKEAELKQDIRDGVAMCSHRVIRFLRRTFTRTVDNTPAWPESFVYDLELSERRLANKGDALETAMNDFVLHYALSKFYSNVSQIELSNKHSVLTNEAAKNIEQLLYTKLPPSV